MTVTEWEAVVASFACEGADSVDGPTFPGLV